MTVLKELLRTEKISLKEVTAHIESLAHPDRIDQVVALGNKEQRKLWDIAENSKPLTLEYLLPRDAKPLQAFPFEGKNSLPAFTRFQKVFYFDAGRNVCGNNKSWVGSLIGPGYYMTQMNPKAPEFEIQIDYTRVPAERPDGWPQIKSNDAFPSMFVYGGTKDNLRWVSNDAVIGRAFKMGEDPLPAWFVLCRQTPAQSSDASD